MCYLEVLKKSLEYEHYKDQTKTRNAKFLEIPVPQLICTIIIYTINDHDVPLRINIAESYRNNCATRI
ncbi:17619_t:CDS:2, partial [Funneliformis caledonium]